MILKIDDDGVWMEVKAPDGRTATINLNDIEDEQTKETFVDWAYEKIKARGNV